MKTYQKLSILFCMTVPLHGCGDQVMKKNTDQLTPMELQRKEVGRLFGDEFLLFGGAPDKRKKSFENQLSVDPFLWRASLETIEFMPLTSVDNAGGIILTDWYQSPKTMNERIKLTIQITDNYLHANAIKVVVHKQVKKGSEWMNTAVSPTLAQSLENVILERARELKHQA